MPLAALAFLGPIIARAATALRRQWERLAGRDHCTGQTRPPDPCVRYRSRQSAASAAKQPALTLRCVYGSTAGHSGRVCGISRHSQPVRTSPYPPLKMSPRECSRGGASAYINAQYGPPQFHSSSFALLREDLRLFVIPSFSQIVRKGASENYLRQSTLTSKVHGGKRAKQCQSGPPEFISVAGRSEQGGEHQSVKAWLDERP